MTWQLTHLYYLTIFFVYTYPNTFGKQARGDRTYLSSYTVFT